SLRPMSWERFSAKTVVFVGVMTSPPGITISQPNGRAGSFVRDTRRTSSSLKPDPNALLLHPKQNGRPHDERCATFFHRALCEDTLRTKAAEKLKQPDRQRASPFCWFSRGEQSTPLIPITGNRRRRRELAAAKWVACPRRLSPSKPA